MKHLSKVLVVFTLLAVASSSAFANYGIKLGFGSNKVTASNTLGSVESDSETKFLGGVFAEMSLIPVISVELGLNYFTLSSTTTYLTVPAVLKAKADIGPVKPYAFIGPELDFKLKDDTTAAKTLAFALAFGGGAEFTIAPKLAVIAEIRYVTGITKMADGVVLAAPADIKYKSLQFLSGLSFSL